MPKQSKASFFVILNVIIANAAILAVMNMHYPWIGHDYTLALPSLLDTAIHYRLNGLTIQWFTPSFGAGIPAFPNPNNMQFSIPALLAVILSPWQAIMAAVVIYVSSGFLACYYFFRRIAQLDWTASILGAFFFSASGFIITRMTTGQIGYLSFTLLAIFLILLLGPSMSPKLSGPLLGLLFAMFIHSAGYYILIIFGLSILIILPPLFIYQPELFQWKRMAATIVIGAILGLVISLSKLTASFAFMRLFPRFIADHYTSPVPLGIVGIILELLGTMNLVPLFLAGGINPAGYILLIRAAIGTEYSLWELDMSMTPVVFAIIGICVLKFLRKPQHYLLIPKNNQHRLAWLLFFLFIWIAIEFTLATGFIYPILRHLPILSSLRGNVRFAGAFVFPLAFLAAAIYNQWAKTWTPEKSFKIFLLVNGLAILPLISYFLFRDDAFYMFYNAAAPEQVYQELVAGESFEVKNIDWVVGKNTGALLTRTSNLNVYEPVFGFKLENFHPQVKSGSVWLVADGYYNMTDPTGYVYPELNHNQPFDRFRVEDKQTMELFLKHLQPAWKIPTYQRVLDWVSGLTFLATVLFVSVQLIPKHPRKTPL